MADAYRDLIAWRKVTDLALEIYRATQKFPKGLINSVLEGINVAS